MFEFIEEDLTTQQPEEQKNSESPVQLSPGEISVSVMPERFRPVIKKKKKGSFLMIVVVVLFIIIAVSSIVVLFILSQPQKKEPPPPTHPPEQIQEEQKAPQEQVGETTDQAATSTVPLTSVPVEAQSPQLPSQPQQPSQEQQATPTPISPVNVLIQGADTDGDGLTDVEERMYGTAVDTPDTDGDGFFDGEELKKLFDPTKPTSIKLDSSSLAHIYTNQTFKYRILYPSSWAAKAVNTTEREAVFTSATGEFMSLKVEDNPQSLSPLDWYVTVKDPGINPAQLQTITGDTWTGVTSSDSRTMYFVRRADKGSVSAPIMYELTYNLNSKNEVNFIATFQMMIQSFTFTDLTFVK